MADYQCQPSSAVVRKEWELVTEQEFSMADPKALWRAARQQAHQIGSDRPNFGKTQRLQADRYLRFAYNSMNYLVYIGEGRIRVEPDPVWRQVDAISSANFFEHSDAQTFSLFCGLVRKRLSNIKVFKRVEVLASSLSPTLAFGSAPPLLHDAPNKGRESQSGVRSTEAKSETSEVEYSSLIQQCRELISARRVTQGLDLLYKTVDDILYAGDYSALDGIFREIDVASAPIDFLLGLLTATLPVKSRLPSRPDFAKSVKRSITSRGENKEGLFVGLE